MIIYDQPIKCQCCPHIETSQSICCANQLTGFSMRATMALNGLSAILKASLFFSILINMAISSNQISCKIKNISSSTRPTITVLPGDSITARFPRIAMTPVKTGKLFSTLELQPDRQVSNKLVLLVIDNAD